MPFMTARIVRQKWREPRLNPQCMTEPMGHCHVNGGLWMTCALVHTTDGRWKRCVNGAFVENTNVMRVVWEQISLHILGPVHTAVFCIGICRPNQGRGADLSIIKILTKIHKCERGLRVLLHGQIYCPSLAPVGDRTRGWSVQW